MAYSKARISPNLNAFLDAIAWAEGTSTSAITRDDGYDIIVTGVSGAERFEDYTSHPFANGRPSKQINNSGLRSSASGRYQFMLKDYMHYKNALGLVDFGPESQDVWATQLIRERKALPLIEAGRIEAAVEQVCNLWASLPGAGYGQQERTIERFLEVYTAKGGKLWASELNSTPFSVELPQPLPPILPETSKVKPKPQPMPEPAKLSVWQKLLAMLRKLK